MITNLPILIVIIFGLTTIATLYLFYRAVGNATLATTKNKSNPILIGLSVWLFIQAFLTLQGVYKVSTIAMPPPIILMGIAPAILTIILLFTTVKGRQFTDSLPLTDITYLNIIRIPVEIILYWLSVYKAVPQLMTFEGRNLDILSGITAPVIAWFGLTKGKLSPKIILAWNLICLGLLINIVTDALLSAPTPFQQFAFDQPNIALINFPFSWLPTFIVPIILFGHLTSIRQLTKQPS
jgi:hypothetical protein